jgi:hypothetical protein
MSAALLLEENKPITIDNIDMNVSTISTVPARLANFLPKKVEHTRAASIKKLKNLMLKGIGPRLKLAATCMASIAPRIDIAIEKVVAK